MNDKLNPALKSLGRIALAIAILLPIVIGTAYLASLLVRKLPGYPLTHQANESLALYNQGDYAGAYKAAWRQISLWGGPGVMTMRLSTINSADAFFKRGR